MAGAVRKLTVVPKDVWRSLGSIETAAGVSVTPGTALQCTAVYACVRILAETVASLPLHVYRRLPDDGKERAPDHPLYGVLHDTANPEMTSFMLRETMMGHLLLWGNAYAELELTPGGQVVALWPWRPDRVRMERVNGQLWYVVRLPEWLGNVDLGVPAWRMLHVRGLSTNGLNGLSPIAMARQAIGLSLATEEFGARFFSNGARPSVVLQHPKQLSDEAYKNIQRSWESRHQGLERAHRVGILEEGMTLQQLGIPPEDAQFLETRRFQLNEICRIYRVPPHMVGDLERATFSNIEHQAIEFVIHTVRPWLVRWEQELMRALFTAPEREKYFAEFLVDGLLRGDTQSRYASYATARQNGWMSANDIRRLENQNPIPGGDVYLVPLNMIPADMVGENMGTPGMLATESERGLTRARELSAGRGEKRIAASTEQRGRSAARSRHRLMKAHRRLYREAAARFIRREVNDVKGAVEKYLAKRTMPADFSLWLEEFYREHAEFIFRQMSPLAMAYGEQISAAVGEELGAADAESLPPEMERWVRAYLDAFTARHVAKSEARLRETMRRAQEDGRDVAEALDEELSEWTDRRADETARREPVRFNNALAKVMYVAAGVVSIRSVAFGKNCPYCTALDGKVIGVSENFIAAGEDFQPDGAEAPLRSEYNLGHAPYHDGCDCMCVAA